ncbi:MAG: 2-oxo acid dehydrogenase subunit E2 [Clostridia bacterium]|nr:2-oxo acid dehydrogenase subunit E2 [Clostridia bacterium]
MGKQKRRFGDRKDARLVRDEDALHFIMPYLMPNRADNEAFISEKIDLTNIMAYLKEKNVEGIDFKYSIFHIITAALARTVVQRPKMNRFIKGHRLYQRDKITLSFVAKKVFSDNGEEALVFVTCDENSTVDTIHETLREKLSRVRAEGEVDHTTGMMNKLTKVPRFIMRFIFRILRLLDYYGRLPDGLCKEDPEYASVFITNLGSIKLNAGYHHLANWGTNSIFVVLGEKHLSPYFDKYGNVEMREAMNIGITLDERIADGYYYSKTIKLFKYLLENPHLLEEPAGKEVDYEQKSRSTVV